MSTTFRRHPWPYASAFSLIGCYTRINVFDRKDLLSQWLSPNSIGQVEQRSQWKTVLNIVGVGTLCRSFDLMPQAIPLAFDLSTWWPSSLRIVAERTNPCLRFCPECIHQGYHSGLFQLPWWRICPIHGQPLLDHCPNCAQPISTSLNLNREGVPHRLFHCRGCDFDLANSAAIVAACHQGVPDVLHRVVGAHRRWLQQVDSHYVVPPVLGSTCQSLKGEDVLALLSLSQVQPPTELQPFTGVPSSAGALPLQIRRQGAVEPDSALQLMNSLNDAMRGATLIGTRVINLGVHQAKTLMAVERRLQHSIGQPMALTHWGRLQKSRARPSERPPPYRSTTSISAVWKDGFRERGYRRRVSEMKVFSNLAGESFLEIKDSELLGLTSVKLVLGLACFFVPEGSRGLDQPLLRQVAEWWYDHFLVLALIDATIYATHVNSYIDRNGSDPYLVQHWPGIRLELEPPGHDWCIAATSHGGFLEAFIMSRPSGPLVDRVTEGCESVRSAGLAAATDKRRIYGEL